MDIRHLTYFLAISEAPSLSVASQRLGVAQPSLSQHMIKLEEVVGVALLVRSPRGVVLTEAGRLLAAHARSICQAQDTCMADERAARGAWDGGVWYAALGVNGDVDAPGRDGAAEPPANPPASHRGDERVHQDLGRAQDRGHRVSV